MQTCMNEKDSQLAQSVPVDVVQMLQRIQGRATISCRRPAQISADDLLVLDHQWNPEAKKDLPILHPGGSEKIL